MVFLRVDRNQYSLAHEVWNYRAVRWTFGRISEVVKYPFYLLSCLLQLARVCKSTIQLDRRKFEVDSCMLFFRLREVFFGLLTVIFGPKRNMPFCFSSSFINKILKDLKNGITGVYKNKALSKEMTERLFITFWPEAFSVIFERSKINKIKIGIVRKYNEEAMKRNREKKLKRLELITKV